MANYSLVVGSKYSPFTFEELLQPALLATQAHQELENQYAELETKASIWEEMANEQADPYAYSKYKSYSDELRNQAELLAKEGLNPSSRKGILEMKRRYSKDIVPIEQAYTTKQKQAQEQQAALLKDPTLLLSRRASNTSLDDYIKNPSLDYSAYSGELLRAQVEEIAAQAGLKNNYSIQDVVNSINRTSSSSKTLNSIVDNVLASSGIANWNDSEAYLNAYDYASKGLWKAIQEDKVINGSSSSSPSNTDLNYTNSVYYRTPASDVNKDIKTSKLQNNIALLEELQKDPSKRNAKKTKYITVPGGTSTLPTASIQPVEVSIYDDLQKELQKQGIDIDSEGGIEKAIEALNKEIKKSFIENSNYSLNITNQSLIQQGLRDRALSMAGSRKNGYTGLYALDRKGRKKGNALTKDQVDKYITEGSSLRYEPNLGIVLDDGKNIVLVDPMLIDSNTQNFVDPTTGNVYKNLTALISDHKDAIEKGDEEAQISLVDSIMNIIYGSLNTMATKQSETSSK